VGRQAQKGIEFFRIDRSKGVNNFFDFFAFGSGMEMEAGTRNEMKRIFELMGRMPFSEQRELVSTSWKDWLDKNCKDPLISLILSVQCQLSGCSAEHASAGAIISSYSPFHEAGAVPFWYPEEGTLQHSIIEPLTKAIRQAGGEIIIRAPVRRIDVEAGRAKGVWFTHRPSTLVERVQAPLVVAAVPLHQIMAKGGILDIELLPEDWQQTIRIHRERADEDLTGFYLLRKQVIPDDTYGWIHLFDAAEGIPNYVGDWLEGRFVNATVPAGKQLVSTFITASNALAPFGRQSDLNLVEKALGYWEEAMEKAFPGFKGTIEHKGYTLQLNWGRYSLVKVPAEIGVRCPTVKGLYFAGDSVHTVGSLASDKVYEVARHCERAILEDRG